MFRCSFVHCGARVHVTFRRSSRAQVTVLGVDANPGHRWVVIRSCGISRLWPDPSLKLDLGGILLGIDHQGA